MKLLPFVVIVVLLVGLMLFSSRNRRRQAARAQSQAEGMTVGTRVMTTSGLYGTVAAKNEDGTIQLAVAPGLELTWELAAVRDVASLPNRMNRPGAGYAGGPAPSLPQPAPAAGVPEQYPANAAASAAMPATGPQSTVDGTAGIDLRKTPDAGSERS